MTLIVFDMDGVIFQNDNFWEQMHEAYDTKEEGDKLTKLYLKSDTLRLADEVIGRMWGGQSATKYWNIIDKAELNPGVKEVFEAFKQMPVKTMILSSGPQDLANRAKDMLGVTFVIANDIKTDGGKITGKYKWHVLYHGKGDALARFCRFENIGLDEVICIGDNENDVSMMREAGLSIAFNSQSELLNEACDISIESNDLREIMPHVKEFIKQRMG